MWSVPGGVLMAAAPPSRGGLHGAGQVTSLWFFAVVKVLSHCTPGFMISNPEVKTKAQRGSAMCPKPTQGGKLCLFITLAHLPPCPRCLGAGQTFSMGREVGNWET